MLHVRRHNWLPRSDLPPVPSAAVAMSASTVFSLLTAQKAMRPPPANVQGDTAAMPCRLQECAATPLQHLTLSIRPPIER